MRGADGDTALHVAARQNDGDVVLTLLQAGADSGAVSGAGETHWERARTNPLPLFIEGTPAWCWLRKKAQCSAPESE